MKAIEQKAITNIRFLAAEAVQKANTTPNPRLAAPESLPQAILKE